MHWCARFFAVRDPVPKSAILDGPCATLSHMFVGTNAPGTPFPKGLSINAILTVEQAFQWNGDLLLFLIRLSEYCFDDPTHSLNALVSPRLRINIQLTLPVLLECHMLSRATSSRAPKGRIRLAQADLDFRKDGCLFVTSITQCGPLSASIRVCRMPSLLPIIVKTRALSIHQVSEDARSFSAF